MAVHLISERKALEFTPTAETVVEFRPNPDEPKPPRPMRAKVEFPTEQIMAVLTLLIRALGSRVILLLAGIGAFVLAHTALDKGTVAAGVSAAVYDMFVLVPCFYLARS
jgi:hypothetical protein